MPYTSREKRLEYYRIYNSKRKEDPDYQERTRAYRRVYWQTDGYKQSRLKYKRSEKGIIANKKYKNKPETKERLKRYKKEYFSKPVNRIRQRKYNLQYQKTDKGRLKCIKSSQKRRATKRLLEVENIDFNFINERDKGVCGICKLPVDMSLRWPNPESSSYDHIIPLSKGGSHSELNLQLAHLCCNLCKSNKIKEI
jgi:5-methylcytosine-specific restriction endonuclease McrA